MLDNIINERYCSMFYDGTLNSIMDKNPFPHAHFPNIFTLDFYREIQQYTKECPKHSYAARGSETIIFYEPFENEAFIRAIYGQEFRSFLSSCVETQSVTRSNGRVPQLRHLVGENNGISIHTDATSNVDFICVFNFSSGWQNGMGGELSVWRKIGPTEYQKIKEFIPEENSMLLIYFGKDTYHSISGLVGEWRVLSNEK